MKAPPDDFVCVDETHFIHLGTNPDTGQPCNSSVSPSVMQGVDERGWRCLGCNGWWARMPKMEEEGIAALAKLRHKEKP
ncbi:MAG TPA: hypothetical protein VKE98_17225 [Gemmataceae bacterium]|nr:hypothetical protein [Gemmataceae bacterium]